MMKFPTRVAFVWLVSLGVSTFVLCKPVSEVARLGSEFEDNPAIRFDLLPENIQLLGGRFYLGDRTGRLPWWFDFNIYQQLFNKTYTDKDEHQRHHVKYIENCVETLRKRVLFRILGDTRDHFIDANSDWLDEWEAKSKTMLSVNPLELGVKLILEELARTESKNQLCRYMEDFNSNRTEVFKVGP